MSVFWGAHTDCFVHWVTWSFNGIGSEVIQGYIFGHRLASSLTFTHRDSHQEWVERTNSQHSLSFSSLVPGCCCRRPLPGTNSLVVLAFLSSFKTFLFLVSLLTLSLSLFILVISSWLHYSLCSWLLSGFVLVSFSFLFWYDQDLSLCFSLVLPIFFSLLCYSSIFLFQLSLSFSPCGVTQLVWSGLVIQSSPSDQRSLLSPCYFFLLFVPQYPFDFDCFLL